MSLLLAALPVRAQTPPPNVPHVVTSGEGVLRTAPDRAFVTVTTESRAPSPREAQHRNTELMKPVQERLRSLGIPAEAIRTMTYDLHQEFDFVNGRRVARGYVAVNSIEVRVDALDRLGELLDAAISSGATAVSEIRFDLKDRPKLEREAVRLAVVDARARADSAAAGAAVDRVLRIEEHGVMAPPLPMQRTIAAVREQGQADNVPIATGQIELRARVTLTAILK